MAINRREFLAASASVPMIGDIIQPWAAGIMEHDGRQLVQGIVNDRDVVYGIVSFYGRMELTGKQLHTVRDDAAWKKLIDEQCDNLKASLYEHVKKFAARDVANIDQYLTPEHPQLKIQPFERIKDTYVTKRS